MNVDTKIVDLSYVVNFHICHKKKYVKFDYYQHSTQWNKKKYTFNFAGSKKFFVKIKI
jgi:hypothetical protein